MVLYKTATKEAIAEQIIDKSRFIAHIMPVENREEAEEFIKIIKKEHRNATHNVPAMVLGENFQIQWASDDGEPQGTSGFPILSMLVNEKVTNVAVVVTRYFGGIKLGTGGLVRAYTSSAKLALEKSGISEVKEMAISKYEIDYNFFQNIQRLEKKGDFIIKNIEYREKIQFECLTEKENMDIIDKDIVEITNGRAKTISREFRVEKV